MNLAGVDLSVFRFDYDLTFAALLMNPDGTIYHVFAGRDAEEATSHLTEENLVRTLGETLPEHEAYSRNPSPPKAAPPRRIEELPKWAKRAKEGKAPDCFHCHMVFDAEHEDLVDRKRWDRDLLWRWPDPVQAGLRLRREDPAVVAEVLPGSAAAAADLKPGDRLLRLGGYRILTFGDVQRALHEADGGKTRLPVTFDRAGLEIVGEFRLPKDWKVADPEVFAWRPSKWPLSPKPGFGGPRLGASELRAAGLPEDAFAMRVGYIVDWGDAAHTGRNAAKAGIRKGDLVLSVAGKDDFTGPDHLHAWYRLKLKAGMKVPVVVLRGGRRETLQLPVVE